MQVRRFPDRDALSRAAAEQASSLLRSAIERKGRARVVAATAASQMDFLRHLSRDGRIAWRDVELFHLDEYIGIPATHPASFRRMLREQLIEPAGIVHYHLLDGDAPDPSDVRRRVGEALRREPIDVAFVGIGENAHLAFNDPPADFDTAEPYLDVALDEACRRQQVGEGWFATLADVPRRALSMSVRQILTSEHILAIVPDARKAAAVRATLEEHVTPAVPASILRNHVGTTLYLDRESASLLSDRARERYQL